MDIPVACWTGEDMLGTLRSIIARPGLECVALGGDSPAVRSQAQAFGVPHHDDLRALAGTSEAQAIVLMDPRRPLEPEVLAAVMSAAGPRPILSMAMRPSGLSAFLDEHSPFPDAASLPRPIPSFRAVVRGRRLIDAAETFGVPDSATVEVGGPGPEELLGTRLLDAIDLLSIWFGIPAFVQASAVQPIGGGDAPPRRLFVIARYPDGRVASITVGADGGRHQRSVSLLGAGGRLRCVDGAIDWTDASGTTVEFEASPPASADDLAIELAESIRSAIADRLPGRSAATSLDFMAVGEACRLAARTGEPEAVDRVRGMLARV